MYGSRMYFQQKKEEIKKERKERRNMLYEYY